MAPYHNVLSPLRYGLSKSTQSRPLSCLKKNEVAKQNMQKLFPIECGRNRFLVVRAAGTLNVPHNIKSQETAKLIACSHAHISHCRSDRQVSQGFFYSPGNNKTKQKGWWKKKKIDFVSVNIAMQIRELCKYDYVVV